jgi:hypothetical protein
VEKYGERLLRVRYVYVRIAYHEADLRDCANRLGAIWRKEQKLLEITFRDTKRLGIADRIVETVSRPLKNAVRSAH